MTRVFVNWTVNNGNLPIKNYHLKHSAVAEDKGWQYASKKVEVNYTSFILEGLEPNKAYKLQLEAINEMGTGKDTPKSPVKTLKEGWLNFIPLGTKTHDLNLQILILFLTYLCPGVGETPSLSSGTHLRKICKSMCITTSWNCSSEP
jgi:Fibronectin type III domain